MAERDERTLRMKQEYMRLHFKEGKSPKEIAELFSLTPTTVYSMLQEIADENGVSRSELLQQPHEKPVSYDRQFEPVKSVEPEKFLKFYRSAMELLDEELKEVREAIKAIEDDEEGGEDGAKQYEAEKPRD